MIGEVSLQRSMMYAAATRKVILFAFTWQTETFTCLGCVCEDITLAPFLFFFWYTFRLRSNPRGSSKLTSYSHSLFLSPSC
jgi:hypothetical protein